ncbi:sulfatase family protein [Polaribacter gangjinensis]|uniref:sulfatase family protein n=1 Tax=Polaribacter gangjinensis TaxID=574710 RepID=UPI000CF39E1D|nr:sulfatase [Polaribacter gangjinensis]
MKILKIKKAPLYFLSTLLLFGCKTIQKEKEQQKPNILFIMTDDHALAAISAYNGFLAKVAPTPNIDKLAKEGMLFNNMLCTNSICGPSRAAILTGKYPHVNGFYKNEGGGDFDETQQTFPKILQNNGYETAVFGKWHLGTAPTGFDYYKVLFNKEGQGSYYDPVFEVTGNRIVEEKGKYSTNVIKEDAINWLKKRKDKSKPFMLMYQFKAPHRPWEPGPGYENYLSDITIPYPATFNDEYKGRKAAKDAWMRIDGHMNRKDVKISPPQGLTEEELIAWNSFGNNDGEFWTPNEKMTEQERKNWKYQRYIKDYLRVVKGVDDAIGAMLAAIEKSGLADNTIIIYTSDQGFYLGEHGWFDKRFMYEESLHMPFIIKYPKKIKPGSVANQLALNIDYAPTLLQLAGIPIPKDIQGNSFLPVLENKTKKAFRDAVYYHYYEFPYWHHVQPHYGIRTERYKLIHYYYDMDEWELFDLENDPNELNNIYAEAKNKELISKLKTRLSELKKEYKMDLSLDEMRKMTDVRIERRYRVEPAN